MPFVTDFVSRRGGRELNEDYCAFLEVDESACWVVADGLGGHQGGEAAARLAVEAAINSFRASTELSTAALLRHLQAAQQAVLQAQKAQPKLSTMRTTIVVLLSDSRRALWAHVGDSRLYCLENGRIVFCTTDHSVVQAMVSAGELSSNQIRHNEDRSKLLRCLGNPEGDLRPTLLPEPRSLFRGTSFLLCSDGFWENINETEMEVDFAKAEGPREWLALMEGRVMEHVNENSDNYTAIAVTFDSISAAPPPSNSKFPRVARIRSHTPKRLRLARTSLLGMLLLVASLALLRAWNWLYFHEREVNDVIAERDVLRKVITAFEKWQYENTCGSPGRRISGSVGAHDRERN